VEQVAFLFSKRRGNPSNTIKEVMEEKKLDCISVSFSENEKAGIASVFY